MAAPADKGWTGPGLPRALRKLVSSVFGLVTEDSSCTTGMTRAMLVEGNLIIAPMSIYGNNH